MMYGSTAYPPWNAPVREYFSLQPEIKKVWTFEELEGLIEAIIAHIEKLIHAEKQRPHNPICPVRIELKKQLKDFMKQFGDAVNSCAGELQPISLSNKEKLNLLVDEWTTDNVEEIEWGDIGQKRQTFCKLIRSFAARRYMAIYGENLLPSYFFGQRENKLFKRRPSCIHEVENLTIEQQALKDRILAYFKLKNSYKEGLFPKWESDHLPLIEQKIIRYLFGSLNLEEIGLVKENCGQYLWITKVIDLALADFNRVSKLKIVLFRSSYDLRTRILKLSFPLMTTNVAYTKTLNFKKMNDRNYLCNSFAWIPERGARHAKIIANELIHVAVLSWRFNTYTPSDFVIMGPTASGKSHALKNHPLFLNAKDEREEMKGVLGPDEAFKYPLKKESFADKFASLVNNQVHAEGTSLFHRFREGIRKQARNASVFIHEGRFSTIEELESAVLNPATKRHNEISILHFTVSLNRSLQCVLSRNPFGKDPCPSSKDIVRGSQQSYLHLKTLVELVKSTPAIKYCAFYSIDKNGAHHLVAEKREGAFTIYSDELFEPGFKVPSLEEIERQLNQVISAEYLQGVPEDYRVSVRRWQGAPLAQAVDMHATGMPANKALQKIHADAIWQKKYGAISIEPFTGSWLKDYPNIVHHLQGEHLLHIRGVDNKGCGLHWQTNKFSWRANPKYNPEAQGGFQMRVGYFIIPSFHVEQYIALFPSPQVMADLEERGLSGELIGYRFFVHPEGYEHFSSLHTSHFRFVKPDKSHFMGTPTSSYRSWAVRRVLENGEAAYGSVPFIIKMGVASDPADMSRLLPKADVVRSIETQRVLDKIDKGSDLLMFPENIGLVLKNISNYPSGNQFNSSDKIDSGLIVREFPKPLLDGKCQIFSFEALMSTERIKKNNHGIGSTQVKEGLQALPLIYEIVDAAIATGLVKDTQEFIEIYLIKGYFKAIEQIAFKNGFAFSPHGQNLCLVLKDSIPIGFAIRDNEGFPADMRKKYIETYTWFYRYFIMVKLLNVMTRGMDWASAPPAAPLQLGYAEPLKERLLNDYMSRILETEDQELNATNLLKLSLPFSHFAEILAKLDTAYVNHLAQYFDVNKSGILLQNGNLPAAESGSLREAEMLQHNTNLWKCRYENGLKPLA